MPVSKGNFVHGTNMELEGVATSSFTVDFINSMAAETADLSSGSAVAGLEATRAVIGQYINILSEGPLADSNTQKTYTVRTELASQFGGNKEVKELPVFVLGLSDQTTQVVNDKLIINVPVVEQDVKNDGSEVIFPITLTNQGPDANTYTLLFDGAGWANIRLTESNTFIVEPEESKTVNVFLSTDSKLAGEQLFTVMVKGNDKILNQLTLKGNVVNIQGQLFAVVLKTLLQTILIGLVVLLVALGLYLGARRYIPRKETSDFVAEDIPDQAQGEAYY